MAKYQGRRMVKNDLIAQISEKQDELTAGTGIDITGDVISADLTEVQEKLTAGDNITIEDGVISATGGDSTEVYGIKLKELWESLGRPGLGNKADLRNITKQDLLENGLPILDTNVAKSADYPYRNLVIDVPTGESNRIILEGIFGVARGNDVEILTTGNSWFGDEPAAYA